jgi:regulator of RNase E activity RraA
MASLETPTKIVPTSPLRSTLIVAILPLGHKLKFSRCENKNVDNKNFPASTSVVLLHEVRTCQPLFLRNGKLGSCHCRMPHGGGHTCDRNFSLLFREEDVNHLSSWSSAARTGAWVLAGCLLLATVFKTSAASGTSAPPADDLALLNSYRHVEVASVSDAMEKILGRKMYMSHRMRPIFGARFAGFALTVQLKKEATNDPHALDGMLAAIDQGDANSVYVMAVEDGPDIAGMGGLMGTAMSSRGFSGAVIDGGVRDVAYLTKIGFPVFAVGIVPSTSVSHYRFAGANIPVNCDGVPVSAGDIVVADADGVAVVPRAQAPQVLALAQEMDFKEHSMYADIEKLKSIQEAVKKFGRL